jgi:chemotaxis protein methyltransferase CheR
MRWNGTGAEVMSGAPHEKTLERFNRYIATTMGLHHKEARLPELAQKIAAVSGEFGYDDPEACMLWLMSAPLSREQQETLARAFTIGETYFFRDRPSYQALEERILPELIEKRRTGERNLRIWSAGCSSGEEAYSVAILLSRIIPDLESWNITLLATDINPRALEKGRQGVYGQWSFRDAPPWLMGYFDKRKDGRYAINPRIKRMVQFACLNLAEDSYPALVTNTNAMDIILCRNVMLYFEPAIIRQVIARFHDALLDDGWLFVSPTEIAHCVFDGFARHQFPGAFAFRKGEETSGRDGFGAFAPMAEVTAFPPFTEQPPQASPAAPPPPAAHASAGAAVDEGRPHVTASPDGLFQEACALFQQGHYEPAADKARELLATRPGADVRELLARSYANLGRLAEARQFCEEALAADRLRAYPHYLLAIILQEQGLPEEAAVALKRALYVDHDFLLAHFALGNLNLQAGRKTEAQRNFANALQLLEGWDPHQVFPDAEGMTAGRLAEIIRTVSPG